jgi:hypothetical protein
MVWFFYGVYMANFKWIALLLCFFVISCSCSSKLEPNFINPKKIKIAVNIGYQTGLKDDLQTKVYVAEAIKYLETELNLAIDVVIQFDFAYQELPKLDLPKDAPKEDAEMFDDFMTNLNIMSKLGACAEYQGTERPMITFCVFKGVIYQSEVSNGAVLGVQSGPLLILSDLKDRELYINVMRHEIGHLMGSPHTESGVMVATATEDFLEDIIGFSQESVDFIKEKVNAAIAAQEKDKHMCITTMKDGKLYWTSTEQK